MLANVDRYEGDAEEQERDAAYEDAPACDHCWTVLDRYGKCPKCDKEAA